MQGGHLPDLHPLNDPENETVCGTGLKQGLPGRDPWRNWRSMPGLVGERP